MIRRHLYRVNFRRTLDFVQFYSEKIRIRLEKIQWKTCNYMSYILISIFVGAFVDRHRKKAVMLAADSIAALASLLILVFSMTGTLSAGHIYIFNAVAGTTTAFQQPASSVAIAKIVPKNKLTNVSGMNSFSSNLIVVFSPMLAAVLFSIGGLPLILLFDLLSFAAAFCVLLFLIHIPEQIIRQKFTSPFAGIMAGFHFLKNETGILHIMLTMAVLNFFSRLTYENILSPMILSRSSADNVVLGIVNACMGIGGIIGGLFEPFMRSNTGVVPFFRNTCRKWCRKRHGCYVFMYGSLWLCHEYFVSA